MQFQINSSSKRSKERSSQSFAKSNRSVVRYSSSILTSKLTDGRNSTTAGLESRLAEQQKNAVLNGHFINLPEPMISNTTSTNEPPWPLSAPLTTADTTNYFELPASLMTPPLEEIPG